MNIGIFAYNFNHKKTHNGLLELFLNGYQPKCILAANPVKLTFYQSKIRIAPKDLHYTHPLHIANKLNIPYHVTSHSSDDCIKLIKKYDLDLGIILGARILTQPVIDAFNIGILNMHPGLLPENRGLDNLKWAVLDNIDQGVTSHLIDRYVDRGYLIDRKSIQIYKDDTLVDICVRIQNLEMKMMIDAIPKINQGVYAKKRLPVGKRNQSVPADIEETFLKKFTTYLKEKGQ